MTNKKEKEYVKDAAAVGVLDGPVGQLLKDRSGRELELVGQDTEGHLVTNPLVGEPVPTQLCTVVESRQILGYGGPLAVENQHGLSKGLNRDGLYTLSNGQRYIVPFEIHEALGIPLPPIDTGEFLLATGQVDPGDERLEGEALEAAVSAKAVRDGRDPETKPVFPDQPNPDGTAKVGTVKAKEDFGDFK